MTPEELFKKMLEDAMNGNAHLVIMGPCPACDGEGVRHACCVEEEQRGAMIKPYPHHHFHMQCPWCDGRGIVSKETAQQWLMAQGKGAIIELIAIGMRRRNGQG